MFKYLQLFAPAHSCDMEGFCELLDDSGEEFPVVLLLLALEV